VNFQSFFEPSNLVLKADCARELQQHTVPVVYIESDTVLQLAQVYGTQVKRTSITLIQMIGSIHQAVKENAVLDSKHVGSFVSQNLAASPQDERLPIGRLDTVKLRIIPGKAKHSDTIIQ
jgi:hypothetical protein